MKILFIRHAIALNREKFNGNDLKRPLTQKGKEIAAKTFKKLSKAVKKPSKIYTSEATRAVHTAQILSRCFETSFIATNKLNPEQTTLEKIKPLFEANSCFVGHEPDFSNIIKELTGASIRLKKAGIAVVEYDPNTEKATLLNLMTPKMLIS